MNVHAPHCPVLEMVWHWASKCGFLSPISAHFEGILTIPRQVITTKKGQDFVEDAGSIPGFHWCKHHKQLS